MKLVLEQIWRAGQQHYAKHTHSQLAQVLSLAPQAGHPAPMQPVAWSGSKSESRFLDRLGLAGAARMAAAQAAAERDQALSRSRSREARRTSSSDAGACSLLQPQVPASLLARMQPDSA